ncbi:MAG: hypothetical protein WCP01_11835 [Methylococcaceae bacterium]|jgi:hypothetical protein
MEELSVAYLTINIDLLKKEYVKFHRFAFWHDVGVTAISALATTLLSVNETAGSIYITWLVPFMTGSVTVFVACDHFFKFRSKADQYKKALHLLLDLQSEVCECESNAGISINGRKFEDIYKETKTIIHSLDVISELDDSVLPVCFRCKQK